MRNDDLVLVLLLVLIFSVGLMFGYFAWIFQIFISVGF